MTHAAVYVSTTDRGAGLHQIRLIVGDRDESWNAPDRGPRNADDPLPEPERAASAWIRERLAEDRRTKDRIAALIVDGSGSMFAWSDIPAGIDAETLAGSIRRTGAYDAEQSGTESEHVSPLAVAPEMDLPEGLTLEPLADPSGPDAEVRRVAMAAVPDLATRLLLDRLDALGIETSRVLSVWQAIALAWASPRAAQSSTSDPAVIDAPASGQTVAAVVIDADGGRLLWSWSRAEHTVACGSCRLARDGTAPEWVFSRLCAEWIGWASQLGVSPARVLVVQNAAASGGGSPPAAILARQWSHSTVDAVELDDPLLATLARASDRLEGDTRSSSEQEQLKTLAQRPGRLHRSSRRWISLAMLAAAVGMGLGSWRLLESADEINASADQARSLWRERATTIDSRALEPGVVDPILFLQDLLAQRQREVAPVARRRPIMTELESVALVIGYDQVDLQEISLNQLAGTVRLSVSQTQTYEDISAALSSIAGSEIDWRTGVDRRTNDENIRVVINGVWSRTGPEATSP